jgi:hypothetical protein
MQAGMLSRRSFLRRLAAVATAGVAGAPARSGDVTRNLGRLWVAGPPALGGLGLPHLPSVPIDLAGIADSIPRLADRLRQTVPAKEGLSNAYTIGGRTTTAFEWMYGAPLEPTAAATLQERAAANLEQQCGSDPASGVQAAASAASRAPAGGGETGSIPRPVHLDEPAQFSMAWTRFNGTYEAAQPWESYYAASLTDAEEATAQFWPTLAQGSIPFNLLILRKVGRFGTGTLYLIDLSVLHHLQPRVIDGEDRFTPTTQTWLWQDQQTKQLRPVYIRVAGPGGEGLQAYTPRDPAWLYALQAAKASITVYGIWLGHAYQWHIVSGALQMTLHRHVPAEHPLFTMLGPQSKYNMAFNNILFLLWLVIGPPTSVDGPREFLQLCEQFAVDLGYFDHDPPEALRRLGLEAADFTVNEPWDLFPVAGHYLDIWEATRRYVDAMVEATYASDSDVLRDAPLQRWMTAARSPWGGNIRGLPRVNSRQVLKQVLTSYLFRITAHGASRFAATLFPALSFISNFPPCLQKRTIPHPKTPLSTRELLAYLPSTATMGKQVDFLYFFIFSDPYERLVPEAGIHEDLFYLGGPQDPRNQALMQYRLDILSFADRYDPTSILADQWPLNIET